MALNSLLLMLLITAANSRRYSVLRRHPLVAHCSSRVSVVKLVLRLHRSRTNLLLMLPLLLLLSVDVRVWGGLFHLWAVDNLDTPVEFNSIVEVMVIPEIPGLFLVRLFGNGASLSTRLVRANDAAALLIAGYCRRRST